MRNFSQRPCLRFLPNSLSIGRQWPLRLNSGPIALSAERLKVGHTGRSSDEQDMSVMCRRPAVDQKSGRMTASGKPVRPSTTLLRRSDLFLFCLLTSAHRPLLTHRKQPHDAELSIHPSEDSIFNPISVPKRKTLGKTASITMHPNFESHLVKPLNTFNIQVMAS
jgi:hypothetical protein